MEAQTNFNFGMCVRCLFFNEKQTLGDGGGQKKLLSMGSKGVRHNLVNEQQRQIFLITWEENSKGYHSAQAAKV